MKRIMVIGPAGAGKTTYSCQLPSVLGLPLHHIDRLFFQDEWKERPTEEFVREHLKMLAETDWIIDGNAVHHLKPRAEVADLLVYLHFSRPRCFFNMFKRWWTHRNEARPDLPENCPEKLNWKLFKYTWNYHKKYYAEILDLVERNPNLQYLEFHNPTALQDWIDHLL